MDVDHRIYVEGSVPKHLRVPGGVRMTDVLVDDYTKNLKEWPVFGDAKFGRAVKLLNGINGNNGTWTGISVSRFFSPDSIAKAILNVGRCWTGRLRMGRRRFNSFETLYAIFRL